MERIELQDVHGRGLVAMTGGHGIVPCGADAGPDCADRFHRTVIVVEINNESDMTFSGVSVASLEFVSDSGELLSRVRDWIDIERLDPGGELGQGGWSLIGAEGDDFDGTLSVGRNRIRLHGWLEGPPRGENPQFRLTFVLGDQLLVLQGEVMTNAWPTG